jgi:hypothetical protein
MGDDGLDPALLEPGADARRAVGSIAREARGQGPRLPRGGLDERLQKAALVTLALAQERGERDSPRVAREVELRAEAPSAVAERALAAPFFAPAAAFVARTLVESTSLVE